MPTPSYADSPLGGLVDAFDWVMSQRQSRNQQDLAQSQNEQAQQAAERENTYRQQLLALQGQKQTDTFNLAQQKMVNDRQKVKDIIDGKITAQQLGIPAKMAPQFVKVLTKLYDTSVQNGHPVDFDSLVDHSIGVMHLMEAQTADNTHGVPLQGSGLVPHFSSAVQQNLNQLPNPGQPTPVNLGGFGGDNGPVIGSGGLGGVNAASMGINLQSGQPPAPVDQNAQSPSAGDIGASIAPQGASAIPPTTAPSAGVPPPPPPPPPDAGSGGDTLTSTATPLLSGDNTHAPSAGMNAVAPNEDPANKTAVANVTDALAPKLSASMDAGTSQVAPPPTGTAINSILPLLQGLSGKSATTDNAAPSVGAAPVPATPTPAPQPIVPPTTDVPAGGGDVNAPTSPQPAAGGAPLNMADVPRMFGGNDADQQARDAYFGAGGNFDVDKWKQAFDARRAVLEGQGVQTPPLFGPNGLLPSTQPNAPQGAPAPITNGLLATKLQQQQEQQKLMQAHEAHYSALDKALGQNTDTQTALRNSMIQRNTAQVAHLNNEDDLKNWSKFNLTAPQQAAIDLKNQALDDARSYHKVMTNIAQQRADTYGVNSGVNAAARFEGVQANATNKAALLTGRLAANQAELTNVNKYLNLPKMPYPHLDPKSTAMLSPAEQRAQGDANQAWINFHNTMVPNPKNTTQMIPLGQARASVLQDEINSQQAAIKTFNGIAEDARGRMAAVRSGQLPTQNDLKSVQGSINDWSKGFDVDDNEGLPPIGDNLPYSNNNSTKPVNPAVPIVKPGSNPGRNVRQPAPKPSNNTPVNATGGLTSSPNVKPTNPKFGGKYPGNPVNGQNAPTIGFIK